MLWACIHLPLLPLEVFQQTKQAGPLVIEETERSRRYVAYANEHAKASGIQIGTSIPTAHSLIHGLTVKQRHAELEQQGLEQIATLAYGFTPTVSIQKPNQILMEIESSLRLFKGLDTLNEQLCNALIQMPFQAYVAYYPTAAGAMLLAKANPLTNVQGRVFNTVSLNQCPLVFLNTTEKYRERLQSMGFISVGELLALPMDALGKRFGHHFIGYLKQLSGQQQESLPNFRLPEKFDRRIDFVEELTHTESLLFPIKRLINDLQHYLIARQLCVRSFVLTLAERFNQTQSLVIQLSKPHYSAPHLLNLIQLQLGKISLSQPVIGVRLQAEWFSPFEAEHNDLFSHHQTNTKDRYQLVDHLRARLGRDSVHGLSIAEDHRPEKAWQMSVPGDGKTIEHPSNKRPLWLLKKPQHLRDKKGFPIYEECLQLMQGPERIETGWWDHAAIERDYYIALHPNGSLLWVFKDLQQNGQWFLHGLFT